MYIDIVFFISLQLSLVVLIIFWTQEKGKSRKNSCKESWAGRLEERRLFHGTDSYDTCFGICTNNFDFRLSGKNATVFGKGSYFAVSAKYSHNYTKGPIHLMFQARVLIGSFAKGREDMTCPPIIKGAGHRRYDSCVDNTTCPSIFVIFDRNQCYPEYLIAYKDNCSMCEENRKNSNKRTPIGFGYNQKSYIW